MFDFDAFKPKYQLKRNQQTAIIAIDLVEFWRDTKMTSVFAGTFYRK